MVQGMDRWLQLSQEPLHAEVQPEEELTMVTDQEHQEFVKAHALISSLKIGDKVKIQRAGERAYEMYVSREPSRSDGSFGSPESLHVTVTFGPGRYATEVGVDDLWRRRKGHGYIGGGTTLEKIDEPDPLYHGGYGDDETETPGEV